MILYIQLIFLGYHNDPTNEEIVNARLQELPAATMKQRGGPKKLCADVSTAIFSVIFLSCQLPTLHPRPLLAPLSDEIYCI